MVLYTIVSESDVFRAPPAENLVCEAQSGRFFECEKGEGGLTLRRMISTNPADYLCPDYAPGGVFRQPSGGRDGNPSGQ